MISAAKLSEKFTQALPYSKYVASGTDEQQRRWKQVHDVARVSAPQRTILGGFVRQMNVLVISGIWCGDCVQQCPLIQRIAEARPDRIDVRFVDRDQHRDLIEPLRMNV